MEVTEGRLLGGRLLYAQPRTGYRTGIEPVLLAAAVPARPGQRVLEAGTGAGAGLMCLATRVPGLDGVGVERDPAMADLARRNLGANGLQGFAVETADILEHTGPKVDHAFANPPWHHHGSTPSPDALRRLAKQESRAGLAAWVTALAGSLRPAGTVTVIVPASRADDTAAELDRLGLEEVRQMLFLPKADRPPRIAIVAARQGRASARVREELVLHEADGRYTAPVEAVLRDGAPLLGLATRSS